MQQGTAALLVVMFKAAWSHSMAQLVTSDTECECATPCPTPPLATRAAKVWIEDNESFLFYIACLCKPLEGVVSTYGVRNETGER